MAEEKSAEKSKENNNFEFAKDLKYQIKCYEHFRLTWMLSHGYSIADLVGYLEEQVNEYIEELGPDMHSQYISVDLVQLFNNWANDKGFGGEIWPCFKEFLDTEYILCGYAEGKGGVKP